MNLPNHLYTDKVQTLFAEAQSLNSEKPILIEKMSDEDEFMKSSAGAATTTDESGNEKIYYDPLRADEYMIAHEIMHIILHRSGWPQMYSAVTEDVDPLACKIADGLDNCLDHFIFTPRLIDLGFDANQYMEWFLAMLSDWPDTELRGPQVLEKAIILLDAMFFGDDYKNNVKSIVAKNQPKAHTLAQRLFYHSKPARKRTKLGVRKAMLSLLNFVDIWAKKDSGEYQFLNQKIAISPLFKKNQLSLPAATVLKFESLRYTTNQQPLPIWIGGLNYKKDGSRIRNYLSTRSPQEPKADFDKIRNKLNTLTLNEFIKEEQIKYGLIA